MKQANTLVVNQIVVNTENFNNPGVEVRIHTEGPEILRGPMAVQI